MQRVACRLLPAEGLTFQQPGFAINHHDLQVGLFRVLQEAYVVYIACIEQLVFDQRAGSTIACLSHWLPTP